MLKKHYKTENHPFKIFEKKIISRLNNDLTIADAGCGAKAPMLVTLIGKAKLLIGIDRIDFHPSLHNIGLKLLNNDLGKIEIENSSVDIIVSKSVMEHIEDVDKVYNEFNRILKPGGSVLLLVPNFWDYVSILSYAIPNRLHKYIVSKMSGRASEDTFPTYYKSNTNRSICRLAKNSGFDVISMEYYGQYPYMLQFNSFLFFLGMLYDKMITRISFLRFLRGWIMVELVKVK